MSYELSKIDEAPLGLSVPQIGQIFTDSGLFKDARSEAASITKILAGRELGLGPFASMSGLHVMQGKVEVGSNVIASAIKRSGRYSYRVEAHSDTLCRIAFYEVAGGEWQRIGESEYTIADAQAAELTRNPTWKKHPKAMLFARAISSGYRYHCPDVFAAPVYAEGEVEPPPAPPLRAEVVKEPAPAPAPKPKAKRKQAPTPEPVAVAEVVAEVRAEVEAQPEVDVEALKATANALAKAILSKRSDAPVIATLRAEKAEHGEDPQWLVGVIDRLRDALAEIENADSFSMPEGF